MKLRFFRQLKALISFRANCRVTSHLGCHLRKEELLGGKTLLLCFSTLKGSNKTSKYNVGGKAERQAPITSIWPFPSSSPVPGQRDCTRLFACVCPSPSLLFF